MPKIDYLGRVVIPKQIRDTLYLEPEDEIEFKVRNGVITISPSAKKCKICGCLTNNTYNGITICEECLTVIQNGKQ